MTGPAKPRMRDGLIKTDAGRRRVELDPGTVAALRAHRKQQAAERLAFGASWADHGCVFTRPGGEPLNPDAVSLQFKRRAARPARRPLPRSAARLGDAGARGGRAPEGGGRAAQPRVGARDPRRLLAL